MFNRAEGGVFGAFDATTQGGEDSFHVPFEQGLGVEPKAGKNSTFEQALRVRRHFDVITFAEFPPDQALLTGDPGEMLADTVAPIGALFLMEIVSFGAAGDFNGKFGSALDVVVGGNAGLAMSDR